MFSTRTPMYYVLHKNAYHRFYWPLNSSLLALIQTFFSLQIWPVHLVHLALHVSSGRLVYPFFSVLVGVAFGDLTETGRGRRERITAIAIFAFLLLSFIAAIKQKAVLMFENGARAAKLLNEMAPHLSAISTDGTLLLVNPDMKPEFSIYLRNGFHVFDRGKNVIQQRAGRYDFDVLIVDAPASNRVPPENSLVLTLENGHISDSAPPNAPTTEGGTGTGTASVTAKFSRRMNYYISPSGNDADSGNSKHPWKTFSHARNYLKPGATLNLMNGTYTSNNLPVIDCQAGWSNGTADKPITISALNERQAWLRGDGTSNVLSMAHCSYWNVVGLHGSSADNPSVCFNGAGANCSTGNVFVFRGVSHVTVRRNIADHNNRFSNSHLISFQYGSRNNLAEENEVYYFSRHGLDDYLNGNTSLSQATEFRRNYGNDRGWAATLPPGAWPGSCCSGQFTVIYGSAFDYVENNIGDNTGLDMRCAYAGTGCSGVQHLGNIIIGAGVGSRTLGGRSAGDGDLVHDQLWVDNVVIHSPGPGFYLRGPAGTSLMRNNTVIGAANSGFAADADGDPANLNYAIALNDDLVTQTAGLAVNIATSTGKWTWTEDHINAFKSSSISPSRWNANITNFTSVDPALGTCYVWLPDGSPMKGAGSGGQDIGANVLYAYENGTKTNKKLWTRDGRFIGQGVIVAGLNDVAGQSLFDIGSRLNINQNRCSFPAGY
jgi:hypothetical protein